MIPFLCFLAGEVLSGAALHLVTREGFDRASLQASLDPEVARQANEGATFLLHPYLGYVGNPGHPNTVGTEMNPMGLFGPWPLEARTPDELVVAIAGGSLAGLQVERNGDQLRRGIPEIPRFQGRRVRLLNLGLGGYKQPQSLLAVSYLLSLGMEPDLVILLDGFNEVALPFPDNLLKGVTGHFPRGWDLLAGGPTGALGGERMGEIFRLRGEREWWRRIFASPLLRWSNLALVLWDRLSRSKRKAITALQLEPRKTGEALPLVLAGPPGFATEEGAALAEAVALWKRSSSLMAALCRARGIEFHHFLQPNQYDEGSKPLSPEEAKEFFRQDHPYRSGARQGYPALRRAGEELAAEGVAFHDLSGIFREFPETAYRDDCCHLSEAGAERVGEAVLEALAAGPG